MIKKGSKILLTILFVFLVSLIATSSVNAVELSYKYNKQTGWSRIRNN